LALGVVVSRSALTGCRFAGALISGGLAPAGRVVPKPLSVRGASALRVGFARFLLASTGGDFLSAGLADFDDGETAAAAGRSSVLLRGGVPGSGDGVAVEGLSVATVPEAAAKRGSGAPFPRVVIPPACPSSHCTSGRTRSCPFDFEFAALVGLNSGSAGSIGSGSEGRRYLLARSACS